MQPLPTFPNVSCEPLYAWSRGAEKFRILGTALDLGLFDLCDTPIEPVTLIRILQTDAGLTRRLINALIAMGLIHRCNGKIRNTDLARAYLTRDSAFYQGHLLQHTARNLDERWSRLPQSLRNPGNDAAPQPPFNRNFIIAMAEGAMRGGLHGTVEVVASQDEFQRAGRLLDLGGGHGLYAISFCRENPRLEALVFDLKAAIDVARTYIERHGMQERVTTLVGDFVTQDWGQGFDIIFASDCLYRPADDLGRMLGRIKRSLTPQGIFISKHWQMDDAGHTSPETAVFFDLMLSLNGPGRCHLYSVEEYTDVLTSAGFEPQCFDIGTASQPSRLFICRQTEVPSTP